MMIEVYYREYEDKGQYLWDKDMLMAVWKNEALVSTDVPKVIPRHRRSVKLLTLF